MKYLVMSRRKNMIHNEMKKGKLAKDLFDFITSMTAIILTYIWFDWKLLIIIFLVTLKRKNI